MTHGKSRGIVSALALIAYGTAVPQQCGLRSEHKG